MHLKNKAFTLLESLLTLGVVCFLALLLSGAYCFSGSARAGVSFGI